MSETALIELAKKENFTDTNLSKAKQLIESGTDVNKQNRNGETAIMWACDNCHYKLVELLLEHRANVEITDKNGDNAFHYLAQGYGWNTQDILNLILDEDTDAWTFLFETNSKGQTPFMLACGTMGQASDLLAEQIIRLEKELDDDQRQGHKEYGDGKPFVSSFNPDLQDDDGKTALMYSSANDNNYIGKILIREFKADVNIKDKNNRTAFGYALETFQLDIFDTFLGYQADIHALALAEKQTLFMHICQFYEPLLYNPNAILQRLINAGIDVNKIDENDPDFPNSTALAHAERNGFTGIADLLKANGAVK